MNASQISLVKKSWRTLQMVSPEVVADAFYSKLFLDHPELRRMFPKDMKEQYRKLIDMLSTMVIRLESPEALRMEIGAMGRRHEAYGVQPKHYAMVGAALIWTLKKGLGEDWSEEMAAAWGACYHLVAEGMMGR